MNIANKERAQIFPVNQPSNNTYSFKDGFPICTFNIAAQNKLLDTNSLRLNGVLRVNNSAGVLPTNNTQTASATAGIALNERIGLAAALNQITLSSPENNRTLEVIRNYGRFLASTMPVIHSQDDYDTNLQIGNPASASKSFNGARQQNNELEFSIPLRTGLLSSGQRLPLGQNGLRGLTIELQLSPDSNALSGYAYYDTDAQNNVRRNPVLATGIGNGAFYQLKNLSLSYDLLVPDEEGMARLSVPATGQINYNSVSQIYGVLNSSDQTQSLNLGTSRTLAIHHNFIPTSNINNYNHDGFSTGRLENSGGAKANIRRVTFLRGGQKFPLDYDLFVKEQGTEDRPQTELDTKFMDSIKPYQSITHTLVSPFTNNSISTQVSQRPPLPNSFEPNSAPEDTDTLPDPEPVFGVGVRLDPLSNVGVDYRNVPYSVRIVSDLDGNSPNSIYTYVLAQNSLMYSPQGIMVQN
jgi:hypothetical protein